MNVFTNKSNNIGWQPDLGVYRGIVIDNNDVKVPNSGRVQVFIPDVHGVNIVKFLKNKDSISYRFPGDGIIGDLTPDVLNYLREICPWAAPCMPIIGESGPGVYSKSGEASASDDPCNGSTDTNAPKYFNKPASMYEDPTANVSDIYSDPQFYMLGRGNAYGNEYRSPSYSNQPKGVYAIPRVGAQLLLAFLKGDSNFPVYIGNMPGVSEYQQILEMDGTYPGSPKGFESMVDTSKLPLPVKPINQPLPQQPNINTQAEPISKQPDVKQPESVVTSTIDKITNLLK
jgi:hypothetical protein